VEGPLKCERWQVLGRTGRGSAYIHQTTFCDRLASTSTVAGCTTQWLVGRPWTPSPRRRSLGTLRKQTPFSFRLSHGVVTRRGPPPRHNDLLFWALQRYVEQAPVVLMPSVPLCCHDNDMLTIRRPSRNRSSAQTRNSSIDPEACCGRLHAQLNRLLWPPAGHPPLLPERTEDKPSAFHQMTRRLAHPHLPSPLGSSKHRHLGRGFSPPSCRTCSAHKSKAAGRSARSTRARSRVLREPDAGKRSGYRPAEFAGADYLVRRKAWNGPPDSK
jgi:hypothetical protein